MADTLDQDTSYFKVNQTSPGPLIGGEAWRDTTPLPPAIADRAPAPTPMFVPVPAAPPAAALFTAPAPVSPSAEIPPEDSAYFSGLNKAAVLTDAQRSMGVAITKNPEDYARYKKISDTLGGGWDPAMILEHPDTATALEQRAKLHTIGFDSLADTNPITLAWLSDPRNAMLSHDIVPSMTTLENIGSTIKDTGIDLAKGAIGTGESLVGLTDIAAAINPLRWGLAAMGVASMDATRPGALLAMAGYDPTRTKSGLETGYSAARVAANANVQATVGFWNRAGALLDNPRVILGGVSESALISLSGVAAVRTLAVRMIAAEGLTAATPAAITGFLTRPDVAAKLLAAGGASEGALTTGQIQEEARQAKRTFAQSIGPALAGGAITGLISVLSGKILPDAEVRMALTGLLGPTHFSPAGIVGGAAKSMFKEGALEEVWQSGQEQFWKNIAEGRPGGQGVLEAAAEGGVVGAAQGGGMHLYTSMHEGVTSILGAKAAAQTGNVEANANRVQGLFDAAKVIGERDPEGLKSFLQQVTDNKTVLVDPAKLTEVLAQAKLDINKVLPTAAAEIAKGELGEIEVPVGELVAGLTGTGVEKALIQHLRIDPTQPTLAEMQEVGGAANAFFQKEAARVLEEQAKNVQFITGTRQVEADILEQLNIVGKFSPQANTGYAKLASTFYTVLADSLGVTPLQVRDGWTDAAGQTHQGYKLSIGGRQPGPTTSHFGQQGTTVNIGLAVNGGSAITAAEAVKALQDVGAKVNSQNVHQSDTEQTLVATLDRPLTPAEGSTVSAALKQESIAQLHNGVGALHGPKAAEWGPFNPDYFLTPEGHRLSAQPLVGLPQKTMHVGGQTITPAPFAKAVTAAREYMIKAGLPYTPPRTYAKLDVERAKRIAQAFEAMKHEPNSPEVKAAYDAMIKETMAQWKAIKTTGLKIEFIKPGKDPYAASPRLAIEDVIDNNHLWVFPTSTGFGSEGVNVSDSPLLAMTDEKSDGHQLRVNDVFRIVHDYFGHIKDGIGFRAEGEENAWRSHVAMYSPLAARAMTTETRGQNSWVNFGPHGEKNRTASATETVYAPQKTGLLPEWVTTEGATDEAFKQPAYHGSPHDFTRFSVDNIGTGEGVQAYGWGLYFAENPGIAAGYHRNLAGEPDITQFSVGDYPIKHGETWVDYSPRDSTMREQVKGTIIERLLANERALRAAHAAGKLQDFILQEIDAQIDSYREEYPEAVPAAEAFRKMAARKGAVKFKLGKTPGGVYQVDIPDKIVAKMLDWEKPLSEQTPEVRAALNHIGKPGVFSIRLPKANGGRVLDFSADKNGAQIYAALAQELGTTASSEHPDWMRGTKIANDKDASLYLASIGIPGIKYLDQGSRGTNPGGTHNLVAFDDKYITLTHKDGTPVTTRERNKVLSQAPTVTDHNRAIGTVAGPVIGVHFSHAPREELSSSAFGQGIAGAERERLSDSNDPRLKHRVAFYVSGGNGVEPEPGLGPHAHVATLDNLYDADADTLKLDRNNKDKNKFESAVLNAGFDGYLKRGAFGAQGAAVLLGERTIPVAPVSDLAAANQAAEVPPSPSIPAAKQAAIAIANDRALPAGQMKPAEWQRVLEKAHPEEAAQVPWAQLDSNGYYYKDDIARTLWAGGEAANRGSFNPATLELRLLANADLSTFLHETGHFFLSVYGDLAARPDAPARVVDDMSALLKMFGITTGMTLRGFGIADNALVRMDVPSTGATPLEVWNNMTLDQQRPYHERFAEAFEQYLFSGKAPNLELQPLFNRFAAWLSKVYASIKEFITGHPDAQLNPEMAAIMDRMLATDAEIEAANAARGYVALFKDAAEAGMTDKQFADYAALTTEQQEDANAMLRSRSMRDMKWLQNRRNKIIAELQADAKEKRAEVLAEVATEVAATPLRRAMHYLKRGVLTNAEGVDITPLGVSKLQISEVKELFPTGALVAPPDYTKLGYGKYGMLAEIGLSPDYVAEQLGFKSGEDLVRQMVEAPSFKDEVEGRTDERMMERYGDLNSQQAINQAADEAIHNDARTRIVATELSHLARNIGTPQVLVKAAKEYARQILETRTMKTLTPWKFAAIETRAGKAALAFLKKGQRDQAAAEKRTELVNHVAAKEAYAVEKELKKIVDRFRKIAAYGDTASAVETRDIALVNAVRVILSQYGVGGQQRAEGAKDYLKVVAEHDPGLASSLADTIDAAIQGAKNYRELTVAEMRDLADGIDGIWFMAKRSRQMEIDGKMVTQQDVMDQLHAALKKKGIPTEARPGIAMAVSEKDERGMWFATAKAAMRRMEFWTDDMDSHTTLGPFTRYIFTTIKDAENTYNIAKGDYLKQYLALLDTVRPTLGRRMINAPELGYAFGNDSGGSGKAELLHAILHTGNESNKRKLLLGRGWAEKIGEGKAAVMDTSKWDAFIQRMHDEGLLAKADYDFAQGVWTLLESMKPDAQKAHRAVFGKYFAEVTADAFDTPFGRYAGGYVPAITDTRIVDDAEMHKLQEQENANMALAFPAPAKGFTKNRVEYNRELLLDLRSLGGHIDKVLLFSHLAVPVNDVRRVLGNKQVATPLNRVAPKALMHLVHPWLNRAAKQIAELKSPEYGRLGRFWSKTRGNVGMSVMMGNLANSVQQLTGVFSAAINIEGKYLIGALSRGVLAPREGGIQVAEKSDYMKVRMENEVSAMAHNINEILLNPSVYESAKQWTSRHAYFMQSMFDNYLSPIIWNAAYNQAMDKDGMVEKDAVRIADGEVRKTQGATGPTDIASFEAGHAFFRMFTQFAGFANGQAQLLGNAWGKNLASDMGMPRKFARATFIVAMGFLVPAIVGELIMQLFHGGPDDENKDGKYLDDWLAQLFFWAPVKYATSMLPGVGNVIKASLTAWNSKPYDDRIGTAPVISAIESGVKVGPDAYRAVMNKASPSAPIRDGASLVGMFTGLPVGALVRPVGYLADVAAGKVKPTSAIDAIRGTITGNASPESKVK